MKEILVEGIGWTRVAGVENRGHAAVWFRDGDDGTTVLGIEVRPYEPPEGSPRVNVDVSAIFKPGDPAARKLRRLATYRRDQQRIPAEMEVQDELRAMEVLAKTLDSLDEETSSRVLSWLTARAQAADLKRLGRGARGGSPLNNTFADAASMSVRIAKKHVLGGEDHFPDNPMGSHAGDSRTDA